MKLPRRIGLFAPLLTLAACTAAADHVAGSSDDAITVQSFVDLLTNGVDRSVPDPHNPWAQKELALNEENVLDGEAQMFATFADQVRQIQKANAGSSSTLDRGFHAKSHACVLGEMQVDPSGLPSDAQLGLFAKAATYPAWVRFSNGVGYRQADKKVDVRGMAVKVMKVDGAKLVGSASTQDFNMTNGPITPAADVQHFVGFGVAMAQAREGSSILGRLENMAKTGGYLLKEENVRTLDFLIHRTLPNTKKSGSVLGDQFWTGAAIALGVESGDPMTAKAKHAIKVHMIPGIMDGDACTPAPTSPDTASDTYLRDDIKGHLAQGDICADVYVQFQEDPTTEPLEDTSVEWKTQETKVARLVVHQIDLDGDSAQAEEAACNGFAFSPWHALVEHRPLGNIMRARRLAYSASAEGRGASPEPTGDERF